MIDHAIVDRPNTPIYALLSGGHDSITATHLASRHPNFCGVIHIDTGTGVPETEEYVKNVCSFYGWQLLIQKPFLPYESYLLKYGFPGPPLHNFFYQRLKERPLDQIIKVLKKKHATGRNGKIALISGVRKLESQRRMLINDAPHSDGVKIWIPVIAEWSARDCAEYIENNDIPRNPVKETLGMSGECLCGAMAQPNEARLIAHYYPHVGRKISAWETLIKTARDIGLLDIPPHQCQWGHGNGSRIPDNQLELPGFEIGTMCSVCQGKTDMARLKLGLPI